jgi:omega-hydroxy-beta-dihydromenaquinone-9 sulfotransferase
MKKHWIVTEEPMAGYTLTNIIRLLWQNKFRIHPKYFLRFLYGIVVSLLLWPMRMWEVLTKSRTIKNAVSEHDPVFIIGYYRSGTTYLITLFSKDPNRGYISNVEGYLPAIFLGAPRFTHWLVSASLPEQRPMDNVVMTAEEPTEEEYSIGAYEKYSIYNGFIFPRNFKLYSRYNSFEGLPKDLARWKKRWSWFHKKMTVHYKKKQMVYKNPTATFRIRHILEMYPNAKFVHLYRNPYHVFSSNVKYHKEVFEIYALQTWDDEEVQETILENYREMYEKFDRDRELIPEGNLIDIKYEDFIQNPMQHMKKIYKELHLDGYEEAEPFFRDHVSSQMSYMPNRHFLGSDFVSKVNRYWGGIIQKLGYTMADPSTSPEKSKVEIPR